MQVLELSASERARLILNEVHRIKCCCRQRNRATDIGSRIQRILVNLGGWFTSDRCWPRDPRFDGKVCVSGLSLLREAIYKLHPPHYDFTQDRLTFKAIDSLRSPANTTIGHCDALCQYVICTQLNGTVIDTVRQRLSSGVEMLVVFYGDRTAECIDANICQEKYWCGWKPRGTLEMGVALPFPVASLLHLYWINLKALCRHCLCLSCSCMRDVPCSHCLQCCGQG